MSDEFEHQAKMICLAHFRKEWHAATEEQRQKSLEIARETHAILSGKWPTHLAGKTEH